MAVIALAGPWPALSQVPAPSPQDSGLRENVHVRLVQLNVLATDKDGHAIADLGPKDLEIRYDGVVQQAAFVTGAGVARSSSIAPVASDEAAAPTGPGEETTPAPPGRTIVLFFENYASSMRTRRDAMGAARRFIEEDLTPEDRVALVAFDGKLNVVQKFTSDQSALLAACERLPEYVRTASRSRAAALRDLVQQLDPCVHVPPSEKPWCAQTVMEAWRNDSERSLNAYLTALTSLFHVLAPVPETKVLVVFSDGLPRDTGAEAEAAAEAVLGKAATVFMKGRPKYLVEDRAYSRLAEAAAHARVSVFAVYPSAARHGTSADASLAAPVGGFGSADVGALGGMDLDHAAETNMRDGLEEMARRTGGAVRISGDALAGLRQVVDLSRGLYVVGFYPHDGRDAETHAIKITALRDGLRLQYGKDLERASTPGRLRGALSLEAGACTPDDRRKIATRLSIERGSLAFEKVAGSYAANFSLYLSVVRDDEAEPAFTEYRFFNISETREEHAAGGQPDPVLEQQITVPCAGFTLAYTVTDSASGATSTFTARAEP